MNGYMAATPGSDIILAIHELQQDLAGRIAALALSPAKGVTALNADVTKGMTDLRAKHRDLELVAEELDR